MEYLIIRRLINRNDVDKIVKQVFKQIGKKFSEFQSNQYTYLRLRSHHEYTECKMISTPELPKVHSFIVKSNQTSTPLITEKIISIDSEDVKRRGTADITFQIANVTITDHVSFRFKLLEYVIKK